MRSLRDDAETLRRLRAGDPELANAIDRDDVDAFQGRMMEMRTREEAMRARRMERWRS